MTIKNANSELNFYAQQFASEIKSKFELFNQNVRLILTIPLYINAGAAISLSSFFYNHANPNNNIKMAITFFILGTIFGIATIVFEFIASHFDWIYFNNYLLTTTEKMEENTDVMLKEIKRYYKLFVVGNKRKLGTVRFRIFNGTLSVLLCLLGIYFISHYLFPDSYLPLVMTVFFLIYCLVFSNYMYFTLKQLSA